MSDVSRRAKIEAMLADEPGDQFLRYALALELKKEDAHDASLELLQGLMADATPHVPSFLMAGQHLIDLERVEEAREVLRNGIDEARKQGESHAAGEMGEFLASIGSLG